MKKPGFQVLEVLQIRGFVHIVSHFLRDLAKTNVESIVALESIGSLDLKLSRLVTTIISMFYWVQSKWLAHCSAEKLLSAI